MNKTNLVIAFFVAALIAGVLLRFNILRSMGPGAQEHFMQKEAGMPLNSEGMGPYDQVSIGGGFSGWEANEPASSASAALPSDSHNPNQLMLMVGNKVDADCCPSAFNTDTGCVCLTEDNQRLFASRGGNRA